MADGRLLIELLEDLTKSQNNDGQKHDALLEHCLGASESDLDEFLEDISSSLITYLPTLQIFISHLCKKFLKASPSLNLQARWKTSLDKFASLLITIVIMNNLHNSDIPGFGELFHNCIELLWWAGNKNKNSRLKLIFQSVFSAILNADGVLGVLVSGIHGHCLKRIMFDFNMIVQIEQEKLLKAVDTVAALVEKCSEHKNDSSRLSVYKACTALLKSLRSHQNVEEILIVNRKNSLPPMLDDMVKLDEESRTHHWNRKRATSNLHNNLILLSSEDEQHLAKLGMSRPQKLSDLPHFLRDLERKKINSIQVLMEFLPCASCHKQALVYFSPDKHFLEEEPVPSDFLYRLPFEFNDGDMLGPWDILLSENTIKDLQKLESTPEVIRAVMKKLGHISSGKWDNYELRCTMRTSTIPVYEIALPDNDLKILWQVDYGFSIRRNSLTQLIKIWAVTEIKERIDKILETLSIVHQVYTSKHLCEVKQTGKGDVILPMILEEEETKSPENGSCNLQIDDEKLLEVHKMLVTNKFVPLSKNLYKSLVLGGFNFTFQVSKKEYEIINSPTSAIVIGRSGTGKTTCIVFRQIASYLDRQLCKMPSDNRAFHKRQIFITVSPNLCHRVKEYFNRLRESAMLAGKKMSKAQFHDYRRKKEKEEDKEIDPMLEERDEEQELDDIPNSFCELTDQHFPLFITYDKFAKMLQETYSIKNLITKRKLDADDNNSYDEEEFHQRSSSIKTTNYVDYNVFQKKYWPHLANDYNFDCELVYSEFSIIKGSNPEVDFLSREKYRNISTKKYPVFSYNRDQIYDLFQRYETLKTRNGHYDSIDRTLAILRLAKKKALGGPHIHEVYIDECQDNQIVDLALILKVFESANSVFMAGDVAQCIARGSSFRFQDLQALMHEWEHTRAQVNHSSIIKPNRFELDINYRSHNGILKLAASVIDLIWRFFPNSIDELSREHSKVDGPQPIILDGFQEEYFKIFSANNRESELDDTCTPNSQRRVNGDKTPLIEFGADQVIIVRDDKAKSHVKKLIDKAGLVMTVFEAKGMEFNDVLLYNFFTDSPARRKWRVILGSQSFSHEHYILSSELEHLYVAVTRAWQHIWICDENSEYIMPIQTHWKGLGRIKVTQSVEEITTTLAKSAKKSSSDEWNQQGKGFFERRQYEQAIFCFEKSGNKDSRELAHAYHLQQIARDSINGSDDDDTIKSKFTCAAKAFIKCSRPKQAALCYQDISMYKEAGDVYIKWNMFEPAAHCYNKANMWCEAGKYFEEAKNYTDAVVAYKNGKRYEKAIELMRKQKIDKKIFDRITRLLNIHYLRANNKEMSKEALSILPTKEEQIKLLRDHSPEEFIEVCEKAGQFRAIAEDLRSHGEFEKAADKFNCSNNDDDMIEALQCLLHLCRVNVLKKMMTNVTNPSAYYDLFSLLSKASGIAQKIKPSSKKSEQWKKIMEEFHLYVAYLNKDLDRVNKCIKFFRYNVEINIEFLAVIIWLQIPSQPNIQAEYWSQRLQYLLWICDLSFPFIAPRQDIGNIEIFEDIFFVSEVENCPQKRQIFFDNPLVHLIDKMHNNNAKKDVNKDVIDNRHVYNVYTVYQTISKFLVSYIYGLIWDAKKRRNIPYIGSQICQNHHVTTPLILQQRLNLQYNVMLKLGILCHCRLLKNEQSKEVLGLRRGWTEKLIGIHIRYQSPWISFPDITSMVLAKLPYHIRNGFIGLAHKMLRDVMIKCMFILQQLLDKWGINRFNWEMPKPKRLLYPNNIPTGFKYYYNSYNGYHQATPVGKRLSLFFFDLYSNHVVDAISNIRVFIQYAISNNESVNLTTYDAFGDLVSLMEFTTSLIFTQSTGYCDFCLPRAYLVSYFEKFTAKPLISSYNYSRENYLSAIKDSFDQIQQLLDILIGREQTYLLIILRLIRLLVLIGINESTFATKVFNLFRYLNNKVSSKNIKKYLEEKSMTRLINVLSNDLKKTGCDSLIIVYYQLEGGMSRFYSLEKQGIIKLSYNSIKEFIFELLSQKTEGNEHMPVNSVTFEHSEQPSISEEAQEPTTEIQAWFHQIHDSPKAQEAAKKIQDWLRQVYKRINSRQTDYDPIPDKIYNDVVVFCQDITKKKKKKGGKTVNKYNILLRGQTVDIIVELIRLQGRMEASKNKLKKAIKCTSNINKIDRCLELEDELKYDHYEKVELALKTLSITENSSKHKKTNIKWLEDELQQAKDIIDQVREWINECNVAVK